MNNLKLCPCCKSVSFAIQSGFMGWIIRCNWCGFRCISYISKDDAVEKWNTKPAKCTQMEVVSLRREFDLVIQARAKSRVDIVNKVARIAELIIMINKKIAEGFIV